jgi:hypothetical protein
MMVTGHVPLAEGEQCNQAIAMWRRIAVNLYDPVDVHEHKSSLAGDGWHVKIRS